MTLKYIPNLALFCLLTFHLNAQNVSKDSVEEKSPAEQVLDSLINRLQNETTDTSKINLLNAISHEYPPDDYNNRKKFGDSALALAIKINWDKGHAEALINIGDAISAVGSINESLAKYRNALEIFKRINDKSGVANTFSKNGYCIF